MSGSSVPEDASPSSALMAGTAVVLPSEDKVMTTSPWASADGTASCSSVQADKKIANPARINPVRLISG